MPFTHYSTLRRYYSEAGFAIYGHVLGSPGNADLVLGLITVVAGMGGTIIGGVAVDKVGASIGGGGVHRLRSVDPRD